MDLIKKICHNLQAFRFRLVLTKKAHNNCGTNFFVDISEFNKKNLKTGIQRVVHKISEKMATINNINVNFIRYSKIGFYYLDDPIFFKRNSSNNMRSIKIGDGDIFLGLDFCPFDIPLASNLILKMKTKGVKIIFVVYDIIPYLFPEFYEDDFIRNYNKWLNSIFILGDLLLCTSKYVENGLKKFKSSRYNDSQIKIDSFRLGSDIIDLHDFTKGYGDYKKLNFLNLDTKTFLMVGTIEPRKNYQLVLKSFIKMWELGFDCNLIIVGKYGWKSEDVKELINNCNYKNKRLFWFNDANDQDLIYLYKNCTALISASFAEGFGLPISEALSLNLPVIAISNEVYKELFSNSVTFFGNENELENIVIKNINEMAIKKNIANQYTWQQSANKLVNLICSCFY